MMIKIARIITRMDLGGAQQAVLSLSKGLDQGLFEQILITGEGGLLFDELAAITHVRKYVVPDLIRRVGISGAWTDLRAIMKIRNILRAEKPDIVHTHTPKAGIVGRWAARAGGVPIIIHTYHGFGFSDAHPFWKRLPLIWAERLTAMITQYFIAVSKNNWKKGETYGILHKQDCELIRSGIDLHAFLEVHRDKVIKKKELECDPAVRIVGTVAGFKPPKALDHFLRVAAMVSSRVSDLKFLVVGDGELRPELEALIRELHLESVVTLMGWRKDIPELLRTFEVFILTSLWEGLPRVLVEARLAGLPVVAYDIDGVAEVIQNGESGFLVGPGDLAAMAARIVELLSNESLRLRLGQVSKASLEEFSVANMLQKHASLYSKLAGRAGPVLNLEKSLA
ncbi:MAG TPA: glycosyltransferase family 4 protein [Terriglobia bacterium]|nr:glycosyltransferase family 4 protein [Terriglobia bacterium]